MFDRLGRTVAPPRFLMFLVLFAGGMAVAIPPLGLDRGVMAGFDVATAVFLLTLLSVFRRGKASQMREASRANDANRTFLLVVTLVVTLVILVSVGAVVSEASDTLAVALVLVTLSLAWLFANVVYALHYAHLFYGKKDEEDGGGDQGGLEFQGTDEPDYWDFLYFSVTLGMAFATSDTKIRSRRLRRIATGQTLAAFVFNLGVIAFAVGALGGG